MFTPWPELKSHLVSVLVEREGENIDLVVDVYVSRELKERDVLDFDSEMDINCSSAQLLTFSTTLSLKYPLGCLNDSFMASPVENEGVGEFTIPILLTQHNKKWKMPTVKPPKTYVILPSGRVPIDLYIPPPNSDHF